jgi:hypothetical protein
MTAFEPKIVDVAVQCFGNSKAVEGEKASQCMVSATSHPGLDEKRTKLVAIKPVDCGFGTQFWAAHIGCRVEGQKLFFYTVPIEPSHGR